MGQAFSEILRQEAQRIWHRIFIHPFIAELQAGTLPLDKFRYYIVQDFHYLDGFGRAVAIALSKAPDAETVRLLTQRVSAPLERPLHIETFGLLGIDEAMAAAVSPSPTNQAYIDHMVATASTGGVGEAAAALLPCPWTYHEIGSRLSLPDHPVFSAWARPYRTGLLEESTTAWRALVDRFGSDGGTYVRDSMRRAFIMSSRYEYMFWTMAYEQEEWPF